MALAEDPALAPIVRATALTLATAPPAGAGAAGGCASVAGAQRPPASRIGDRFARTLRRGQRAWPAAAPLLADPVRGVRVEAARVLADVPDEQIPTEWRSARAKALQEYVGLADRGCGLAVVQHQPGQPALAPGPGGRGDRSLSARHQARPALPGGLPEPGRCLAPGWTRSRR